MYIQIKSSTCRPGIPFGTFYFSLCPRFFIFFEENIPEAGSGLWGRKENKIENIKLVVLQRYAKQK
jgi:hypothetical protein